MVYFGDFLEILVDVGGQPGIDCRGFCHYCYFKKVNTTESLGCKHCLPFKKGCHFCTKGVQEAGTSFKPLRQVLDETLSKVAMVSNPFSNSWGTSAGFVSGTGSQVVSDSSSDLSSFVITGGGDVSCYPDFKQLISFLSEMGLPIKIGYTSGKGFESDSASFLIDHHVSEVNFTLFSSDPDLRRQYMHDPHPDLSLRLFCDLCRGCDVYAAVVLLPGINDGSVLEDTLQFAQDAGAKGVLLMRFANSFENGLILKNAPIIEDVTPHSIDAFRQIVHDAAQKYTKLRITGTPLDDPLLDSPFIIRNRPEFLEKLPPILKEATVITGQAAAPRLSFIFEQLGGFVNVVSVKKDIACLITIDDLRSLDLSCVLDTVFIPGRSFVHDRDAKEALTRDGVDRIVRRGPDTLSVDAEISAGMTQEQVIAAEMEAFSDLIHHINAVGMPIRSKK